MIFKPLSPILIFSVFAILAATVSCKKDDPDKEEKKLPIITTQALKMITQISAVAAVQISLEGDTVITDKGICWSTAPEPTIKDSKLSGGAGPQYFRGIISGLTKATKYYVRAYAVGANGTAYGNEINFTTSENIAIGQNHLGGLIFYLDGTGQHGLLAAPTDQSTSAIWGCDGLNVVGTSTAFGSGNANTTAIVSQCFASNTAARICYSLVLNGYSDWYLPSRDELTLMHQNLYMNRVGDFKIMRYWSSSQASAALAHFRFFNENNNPGEYYKNLIPYYVRAIRTF